MDFITRGLDNSNDLHAMAIGTYVLSRANHNTKSAFLQRLDAMAVNEGLYSFHLSSVFFFSSKNLKFEKKKIIFRWQKMVE